MSATQQGRIKELETLVNELQLENKKLKQEIEEMKSKPEPVVHKPVQLVIKSSAFEISLTEQTTIILQEYLLSR